MMELLRTVDAYCERTGPEYWSEPVNAVTNAAFLIAALVMWRRSAGVPLARAMCVVLAAIGIGSWLFHTHAQVWAAIADVAPIAAFILLYLFAMNRDAWGFRVWPALGLTALFFPYAALTVPLFEQMSFLGSSAGYAPVALLILIYAALFRRRRPDLASGLATGACILILSLTFRTIDLPLCAGWPLGTHFVWHLLNGLMLGWMIHVYLRSGLGNAPAAR